ncbi:hypothetical protein LTR36_003721 [Oleoguttula mirabilis]|uniref:CBF1-interacting co-repressor CIR N-terminal domain-containing protein n=1 Tax=Oleoguttula mirabilis TaxID=1507867 RepID=A0AAV9JID2_9PEZI|nr:hypothetical protein LTR36_003721 [Oleoguttula mirabilis]
MVLHLLDKKSWNVYNNDNIEQVRRDEVEAKAREEADEQRMQEEDAARRTSLLRGEVVPDLIESAAETPDAAGRSRAKRSRDAGGLPRERKRRRVRGEDDTDKDIRYAREDAEESARARLAPVKNDLKDAPLIDHAGHLQLIPAPDEQAIRKSAKNAEAEAEKAKKRTREEDQNTMRFRNAAGFKNGTNKPWYASNKLPPSAAHLSTAVVLADAQEKDVWGNADPLRKQREQSRISSSDPFAAMQQAQRQLKQSGRDRESWDKERLAELEELKRTEENARRREKQHRRRADEADGLENFSLDAPLEEKRSRREHGRHEAHRHRRHRSRSRSRERSHRRM